MQEGIFSAAYSGNRVPFCPSDFLTCWWQHSDALVGYQQQDAHEFYIFLLSGLESSKVAATATPSATSTAPGANLWISACCGFDRSVDSLRLLMST